MLNVVGTGGVFLNAGNVGIGVTSSPAQLSLAGGDGTNLFTRGTITLGYGSNGSFPHTIHTRHQNSGSGNAIDFYTNDGSDTSYPSGSVHNLSMVNGKVGIGTTNPSVKLSVSGGQFAGSYLSSSNGSSGTPINWNSGNIQTTSIAAGTLYLDPASMVDGAGYTLILTNATGGSYTLSSTGYTFMCNPACPVTVTAAKHTIASMIKAGTVVYVSWVKDFQ